MAAKKVSAKKAPAKKVPSPPKAAQAKRGVSNFNPSLGNTANIKSKGSMPNAKGYTPEGAWALGQSLPGNNMRGKSKMASNLAALRKEAIAKIRADEQAAAKNRLSMAKKSNETPGSSSSYPAKSSGVGRYSPNTNRKGYTSPNNLAGLGRRILENRIQEEMKNIKQSKRNNKKK